MTALSRRGFLVGSGAAAAASFLHPRVAFAAGAGDPPLLVVLALDGGLDGLSTLVPAGDAEYARLRSATRIPADRLLAVDGTFGLHPALAPIAELWQAGLVAAVPAVGTATGSRSHFYEASVVAAGTDGGSSDGSGWLARHLLTRPGPDPVVLRGVAVGAVPSPELQGDARSFSLTDLATVGAGGWGDRPAVSAALAEAYRHAPPKVAEASAVAFDALARLEGVGRAAPPASGYGDDLVSRELRQVAQLVRAGIGVEAAVVRAGGFDTHTAQGTTEGALAHQLAVVARALHAFTADLADHLARTTIVVLSEFGRRARENGGGGTDHGRGGLALVIGGGIRGGVRGTWPGLAPDQLDDGDLRVTTDVRSLLAEIVTGRLGNPNVGSVFPGLAPAPVGVV